MHIRRSIVVLALVTLVLPVVIFARRAQRDGNSADAQLAVESATLQQYTVTAGEIELLVSAVGAVEPDRTLSMSFTTPGRIAEINVVAGQRVMAGDVLMRQVDETQRLALESAELVFATAQLEKERLLTGPTEAQLAVAEANIDAAIGAYNSIANAVTAERIQAAELSYQAAQQAVVDAQAERATSGGSPESIALLDARVGSASFNAEIARLNLETARQGSSAQQGAAWARVQQAEAQRDQVLAGATQAQLDAADVSMARAQINFDRAQRGLAEMQLVAPFEGVVAALTAEIGGIAVPGLTVIEVADLMPLRVRVQVDEIDVRQVRAGMDARVRVDALPSLDIPARLESVAFTPTIDNGIVTYDVEVIIPDADARVRVGLTAEAQVIIERRGGVLVVPNQYIRLDRRTGEAFVQLLRVDGRIEEVPVLLGLQGVDASEITSGVQQGDVVVVDLGSDAVGFGG